jgi:hypothetical protein
MAPPLDLKDYDDSVTQMYQRLKNVFMHVPTPSGLKFFPAIRDRSHVCYYDPKHNRPKCEPADHRHNPYIKPIARIHGITSSPLRRVENPSARPRPYSATDPVVRHHALTEDQLARLALALTAYINYRRASKIT